MFCVELECFYCGSVCLIQHLAYLFWHSAPGHDKHWMKIELPGCIICLQERCGSAPGLLYSSVDSVLGYALWRMSV
jgi:hypothetical protein